MRDIRGMVMIVNTLKSTTACVVVAVASLFASQATGKAPAQTAVIADRIYPESNARLPKLKREELDAEGKRIYDSLVKPGARYTNGLTGPAGMWIYSPEMAERATALGEVVRSSPILGRRLTELAIVVTGTESNDPTEVTGHSRAAVAAGLNPSVLDVVRDHKATAGLDENEAVVIEFGRQVVGAHRLDRSTFDKAITLFGTRGVTDLQALIGHYMLCAATNATFDIVPRDAGSRAR